MKPGDPLRGALFDGTGAASRGDVRAGVADGALRSVVPLGAGDGRRDKRPPKIAVRIAMMTAMGRPARVRRRSGDMRKQ